MNIRRMITLAATSAAFSFSFSGALLAQADKDGARPAASGPIATVNGVAIPRQRAETLVRMNGGAANNEQLQTVVKQQLIDLEIVSQEAVRSGLAKSSDVQIQIDMARQQVLARAYMNEFIRRNPVSDADVQAEYERAKSANGPKEYRARHILVATEDEASKLIAELKRGAKFEDLAGKNSKDTGTKDRGGDLNWSVPGNYDKVFADAMVKLEKGKITEHPVRTRFGFHVIRLDDVREFKFPALSEVKPQIQQQLSQRKIDELLRSLRTKAKVE